MSQPVNLTRLIQTENNLDIARIQYGPITDAKSGMAKLSSLKYLADNGDSIPLKIQVSGVIPFGAQLNKFQANTYNVNLSVDSHSKLFGILQNLDLKVQEDIRNGILPMYDDATSLNKAEYHPILLMPKKVEYNPTIKIKIPFDADRQCHPDTVEVYDKNKMNIINSAPIAQLLPAHSNVKMIITLARVWKTKKEYGLTLQLDKVYVTPKTDLRGCIFLEDEQPMMSSSNQSGDDNHQAKRARVDPEYDPDVFLDDEN